MSFAKFTQTIKVEGKEIKVKDIISYKDFEIKTKKEVIKTKLRKKDIYNLIFDNDLPFNDGMHLF